MTVISTQIADGVAYYEVPELQYPCSNCALNKKPDPCMTLSSMCSAHQSIFIPASAEALRAHRLRLVEQRLTA